MTSPIDIVAAAVHRADCGCGQPTSRNRDEAVQIAATLADERIVDHAARALAADTASRPDSPLHAANMTVAAYEHIAQVVLRSVGGA